MQIAMDGHDLERAVHAHEGHWRLLRANVRHTCSKILRYMAHEPVSMNYKENAVATNGVFALPGRDQG